MQETVDEGESHEQKKDFDGIEGDKDVGVESQTRQKLADEEEMVDELPLPGVTSDERDRKTAWLKLPRAARAAIRRMHMQFGHVKEAPFMETLKAAKCPPEYLEAARHFRCNDCEYANKLPLQTNKVSMPRPYEFNHTVGMDVNYCRDFAGNVHMFLNLMFMGNRLPNGAVHK